MSLSPAPSYQWEMLAATKQQFSGYPANWLDAIPITVIAATKDDAIGLAETALGRAPGKFGYWVFRVRSIKPVTDTEDEVSS